MGYKSISQNSVITKGRSVPILFQYNEECICFLLRGNVDFVVQVFALNK